MDDSISKQTAIDLHCELCGRRGRCNPDICDDVELFRNLPPAKSDPDAEFWENRAAEYSKIIASLVANMCKGINFESMQITETGKIIFGRGEPNENNND